MAYHGVTLGALSFTGVERLKAPFGRAAIDVAHVSNTTPSARRTATTPTRSAAVLDEVEATILAAGPGEIASIIAEPVRNAGGCLAPPPGYCGACASWPIATARC